MLGQLGHGAIEAASKELLRNVEALQFVHRFDLLLSLCTSIVEGLVLLLNEGDFALDFLFPLSVIVLLSFLILLFELANLLQLGLFFDLKNGLLNGFSEEHIKNWLHFSVIVE